ncbi:hypothetical protein [Rossellomorea marisflavi]|uniref:hypothetical protein n=1 Tax=Rossellomorea marisflavi TaxID=189381 RepID=UPI003F9F0BB6
MKMNHDSIRDNKVFDDDLLTSPVAPKEEPVKKEVVPLPKIPKRKWSFDSSQRLYVFHLLVPLLMAVEGVLADNPIMFLSIVPYVLMVLVMRRLGGGLENKGLDYILWNMSVLISTYTNAEMPRIRHRRKLLMWGGAVIAIASSIFSPWFLFVGSIIAVIGMVFAFADKEPEQIAKVSQILSIALLVTGGAGMFHIEDLGLASLFLSLVFHLNYEKWKNYEFYLDVE